MRITKVLIELRAERKIFRKHRIYRGDIEDAFFEGSPVYFKTKDKKYIGLTKHNRCITVIFSYKKEIASVITAYPSSDWQIRLYKRKRS